MDAASSNAIADVLESTATGPSAVIIEGEAGIGKTTLWLTAVDHSRERGFQVLSAQPSAAESVEAYASLADLLAGVDPRKPAGLTPSEQRVAELSASGMTNRGVAATLFISPKTVEANLSRIYNKLGIRSRAQLGHRIGKSDGETQTKGKECLRHMKNSRLNIGLNTSTRSTAGVRSSRTLWRSWG